MSSFWNYKFHTVYRPCLLRTPVVQNGVFLWTAATDTPRLHRVVAGGRGDGDGGRDPFRDYASDGSIGDEDLDLEMTRGMPKEDNDAPDVIIAAAAMVEESRCA